MKIGVKILFLDEPMSPIVSDQSSCVIEKKMSGLQIDLSVLSAEDGNDPLESPPMVSLLSPTSPPVCFEVKSLVSPDLVVSSVL